MFNRHLQIQMDDKEAAITMAAHPKVVKELFIDCTASFDYELHVRIDGKELRYLNPKIEFDGYHSTFYFEDTAEITVGSRVEITLVFWYKDKMVRQFNGSTNVRRDEISQATEHWTYMEDDQFHIDPEDVDPSGFLEMLKPEWRMKRYETISIPGINDGRVICGRGKIIDVDFTEVESEEMLCSQEKIKQIEIHS